MILHDTFDFTGLTPWSWDLVPNHLYWEIFQIYFPNSEQRNNISDIRFRSITPGPIAHELRIMRNLYDLR